jgi:threonine-phosphate decarboxylase
LGITPAEILDFSASINPLGPSPLVREAVTAALDRVVHYPEMGSPSLCEALAAFHGIPADCIAVANGSTELIHLIPRFTGMKSGRALIVSPAFSEYAHALELAGWSYDYLNLSPDNRFALDGAEADAMLARGYDLFFLCNPGNPTGKIHGHDEIAALTETCRRHDSLFVLDEAFIDFTEERSAKQLVSENDNLLILRSMTKFFGFPGLRVGYALASPRIAAGIRRLLPPWGVGVLAEAAALAALTDNGHCLRTKEYVAGERQRLAKQLANIPALQVFPGAANYLLVQIHNEMTASELQAELLTERILIRNCGNFAGLDERFFRIAVRKTEENDRLLAKLTRIFRRSSYK